MLLCCGLFRHRRQTGGGPKRGWRTGTQEPAARKGSPPGPPLNRRNKGATDAKKAAERLESACVDRVAKPGHHCLGDAGMMGAATRPRQAFAHGIRGRKASRQFAQATDEGRGMFPLFPLS